MLAKLKRLVNVTPRSEELIARSGQMKNLPDRTCGSNQPLGTQQS
jgi:hypothetical protein